MNETITNIIYCYTVSSCVVFLASIIHDRRKLMNGFLFTNLLLSAFISFSVFIENSNNQLLKQIYLLSLVALLLSFTLIGIILVISLFASARRLLRNEGVRISNLLSLGLGISIIVLFIFAGQDWNRMFSPIIVALIEYIYIVYGYFMFVFFTFLVSSFLYQLYHVRLNKDVIIVLGSGLLQKRFATPLLKRRIDRALKIYDKQRLRKRKPKQALLLFSGGKGEDEEVSEAHAMRDYAMHEGILKDHILLEEESSTTYENMLYSKKILDEHFPYGYKAVFSTSNYHVFRSSIYAKQVGLNAQGVGAKTPFYFWTNAMIREYIAIITMYKRWHVIILVLLCILHLIGIILR